MSLGINKEQECSRKLFLKELICQVEEMRDQYDKINMSITGKDLRAIDKRWIDLTTNIGSYCRTVNREWRTNEGLPKDEPNARNRDIYLPWSFIS